MSGPGLHPDLAASLAAVRTGEPALREMRPLIKTSEGGIKACFANAVTLLRGAPVPEIPRLRHENPMNGVLGHCEFRGVPMMLKPAPWVIAKAGWGARPWENSDDLHATDWLQNHEVMVKSSEVSGAVEAVAWDNRSHPVRDYLNGLVWDGTERLNAWLHEKAGADGSALTEVIGSRWMISCVARVMAPGCKADCVLILEGVQGKRKSTVFQVLGSPWFADDIADLGSKDAALQASGVWILEIAELDSMSRGEVTKTKAFITRQVDRFRPPYGRRVIASPRQCVFGGTTNRLNGYMRDETGGRRFWPVRVSGEIDIAGLKAWKDQLWAEAVHRYEAGERWWIDDQDGEVHRHLNDRIEDRDEGDAWQPAVLRYIHGKMRVSVTEILQGALYVDLAKQGKPEQMRVGQILTKLKWRRVQVRVPEGRVWVYVPPDSLEAAAE